MDGQSLTVRSSPNVIQDQGSRDTEISGELKHDTDNVEPLEVPLTNKTLLQSGGDPDDHKVRTINSPPTQISLSQLDENAIHSNDIVHDVGEEPETLNTLEVQLADEDTNHDHNFALHDDDFVGPIYLDEDKLDLAEVFARMIPLDNDGHPAPALNPRIQASIKANLARSPEEFWTCGVFNTFALPYLDLVQNVEAKHQEKISPSVQDISEFPAWTTRRHRKGDVRAKEKTADNEFKFSKCCACAGYFEVNVGQSKPVSICAGIPVGISYTAISYVWGLVRDMVIECAECGYLTMFPMESVCKFRNIVTLAGAGAYVWLDALSIDQADPDDIAVQVAQMGSIYKNASRVTVLLPEADLAAFTLLEHLSNLAKQLLNRPANFVQNYEDSEAAQADQKERDEAYADPSKVEPLFPPRTYFPDYGEPPTSVLVKDFADSMRRFAQEIRNLTYWQRAWTFQEWSLAREIDIGLQGGHPEQSLSRIKTLIFSAASLLAQYSLVHGNDYCKIRTRLQEDEAVTFFDMVKRLFPFEDILLLPEEISSKERFFQYQMASISRDGILGLRTSPRDNSEGVDKVKLQFMLDAFRTSDRKARYPADLVACWASMCNIKYGYDKNDTVPHALFKVKAALRKAGVNIFDFVPSQMDTGAFVPDGKPSFFRYSIQHTAMNTNDRVAYIGLPLLSGRADTLLHIMDVLRQDVNNMSTGAMIQDLQVVQGAQMVRKVPLTNGPGTIAVFRDMVLGTPMPPLFEDQIGLIAFLSNVPQHLRAPYALCQFFIPTIEALGSALESGVGASRSRFLKAWAIIPGFAPPELITIAREKATGALVVVMFLLARTSIAAYLVVTDQTSGTQLLRCNEDGYIDIRLQTPMRRGIKYSHEGRYIDEDRHLQCKINLGAPLLSSVLTTSVIDDIGREPDYLRALRRQERAARRLSA